MHLILFPILQKNRWFGNEINVMSRKSTTLALAQEHISYAEKLRIVKLVALLEKGAKSR